MLDFLSPFPLVMPPLSSIRFALHHPRQLVSSHELYHDAARRHIVAYSCITILPIPRRSSLPAFSTLSNCLALAL
jgi:hypothetical protein